MITAEDVEGVSTPEEEPGVVAEFRSWLGLLVERGGSDLHLKVGAPP